VQAVVTVLALSCLAPILAGMVILPGQPLQCIVNESDAFFKEVQRVVGSGEAAQMAIQDIYPALQEIRVRYRRFLEGGVHDHSLRGGGVFYPSA